MNNAEIDHYLNFLENTAEQEHKEAVEAIKASLEQIKEIMERVATLTTKDIKKENDLALTLEKLMRKLQINFDKLLPTTYKERDLLKYVIDYLSLVITMINHLNEKTSQIKDMQYMHKIADEIVSKIYFCLSDFIDKKTAHYEQQIDSVQKKTAYYEKLNGLVSSIGEKSIYANLAYTEKYLKDFVGDVLGYITELEKQPSFAPTTKV